MVNKFAASRTVHRTVDLFGDYSLIIVWECPWFISTAEIMAESSCTILRVICMDERRF